MRSRTSGIVSDRQVQDLAESWLREALPLEDVGWKCTAQVLWQIVLLAAARMVSLFAACRDLADAPSDDAVRQALVKCLPKRPRTLEEYLAPALAGQQLPKALFVRGREVALDFHQIPYHGQPHKHANELYHSQPKSGTTKFHCYATACIVEKGFRYTLAATYVKGNESLVAVIERLLLRLAERGLLIKTLLLDRQFFTMDVLAYLQSCQVPFVMPLVLRGKKPKRKKAKTGRGKTRGRRQRPVKLRDFQRQAAGRYAFTWTVKKRSVSFHVVVAYKSYRHQKTGSCRTKKLLYAVWRVNGTPTEIREQYRRRFGIESSYRQLGLARIRTCTTDPVLRLFFVLVALVLRNVWVWLHFTYFATRRNGELMLHLECLRFRRMLTWIAHVITNLLHDGSNYATQIPAR
jgi:putative transposase